MIYTQFNAKIQTLRSNNGKEYFNQTFHLIFEKRFSFINFFVPKHHNNLKLILACHLHNKSLPPNQHTHLELEIEPEIEPKIEPLPNRIQEKGRITLSHSRSIQSGIYWSKKPYMIKLLTHSGY